MVVAYLIGADESLARSDEEASTVCVAASLPVAPRSQLTKLLSLEQAVLHASGRIKRPPPAAAGGKGARRQRRGTTSAPWDLLIVYIMIMNMLRIAHKKYMQFKYTRI